MKVLTLGNELLRQKSLPVEEVNDEIKALIEEMFITMEAENGVGLAAPQVGRLLRLFVIEADDGIKRTFINPQITGMSTETCLLEEGCLSIPKLYEEIERPVKVSIQALNEHGKPFVLDADGFLARIIQHEYDHLEGIMYIDRGDPEFKEKAIETIARREKRRLEKDALKQARAAKIASKKAGN